MDNNDKLTGLYLFDDFISVASKQLGNADAASLYNTPPTYSIYILKLVLEQVKEQGGVKALQKINEKKAKLLYDFLDNSKMFKGTVVPEDRSLMNIPFVTGDEELDAKFVKESKAA